VFWGDQIFVPSAGTPPSGGNHADILACLGPMPSQAEWTDKGLDKYGLIAVNDKGQATQVRVKEDVRKQRQGCCAPLRSGPLCEKAKVRRVVFDSARLLTLGFWAMGVGFGAGGKGVVRYCQQAAGFLWHGGKPSALTQHPSLAASRTLLAHPPPRALVA
jgi:hypothetical protein